MNRRTLHLITGSLALLAFIGTGMYMDALFPEVYAHNEAIRYQFRANHIYMLMSGLVNLAAGLDGSSLAAGWPRTVARAATALLLIAPVLLLAAFLLEPARGAAERPVTFYGVVTLVSGVLLAHAPVALQRVLARATAAPAAVKRRRASA